MDLVPAPKPAVAQQGPRGRRYETGPGRMFQMDWGFVNVVEPDGSAFRAAVFAMVCHHCGMVYIEFFTNARQENLFIGMVHAFVEMGVPEVVLTDNMASVSNRRGDDGAPIWNACYDAFQKACGFRTVLCRPRHPFTKGKVERLVRFVKGNFVPARTFRNLSDLNVQALGWCRLWNSELHRSTGIVPSIEHISEGLRTVDACDGLEDVRDLLERIYMKGYMKRRSIISDLSGIPQTDRRTFDNYDFSRTTARNRDAMMALRTLSFLGNGYNVVITGSTGTGKTHIAQAIGNECIDHLVRTSFMTLSALKARVSRALRNGRAGALVSSLASIQCLIIDEVDKCSLSKDECAVLFDIVDRKYSNRGKGSMVLTANTQPSAWSEVFQDGRLAECLLDRLFDKSYCFDFEGPSYRDAGKVVSQVNFAGSPALPPRR